MKFLLTIAALAVAANAHRVHYHHRPEPKESVSSGTSDPTDNDGVDTTSKTSIYETTLYGEETTRTSGTTDEKFESTLVSTSANEKSSSDYKYGKYWGWKKGEDQGSETSSAARKEAGPVAGDADEESTGVQGKERRVKDDDRKHHDNDYRRYDNYYGYGYKNRHNRYNHKKW